MPALPSISFAFTSKAGERLEWRSQVSVSRTGEFHCTFPEELVPVAQTELSALHGESLDRSVTIDKPRTQWQVQGPNLEECKAFLRRVAEAYLRTQTTIERIIVYHIDPSVSYFRLGNGTIRPNAAHLSDEEHCAGRWQGSADGPSGTDHYRLGLFAQVLDRVTEQRGEHVAVRYVLPQLPDASWGARLNSWTHLRMPTFRGGEPPWPHVPYTESAAEFFYRMILRLCAMTDQLTTFFTDSASVAAALQDQSLPALPDALWAPEHARKGLCSDQ